MRMTRLGRVVGATVATAVVSLVAAPAHAAQGFDLRTADRDGDDGYAVGNGSVTFHDRNSISWSSSVADRCSGDGDGDGDGAYLWIYIEYMDGATGPRLNMNFDNEGCDNGSSSVSSPRYDAIGRIRRV